MTIIIYHLENINGKIEAIEWGRWKDGKFSGRLKASPDMTKTQIIDRWNRGHWRTSEV